MKLSIIMPGVRVKNWAKVYNSIPNATAMPKTDYELVIVSPYNLPPELRKISNIRFVKDYGCPTRCHQIGLIHSQGEYVVWGADDGLMLPGMAIDKAFAAIPQDKKGVVSLRYGENHKAIKLEQLKWWRMKSHTLLKKAKYIPKHYMLIMIALIRRDYLIEVGGWDCRFEQPGISCVDLAVRLQNDGAQAVLGEKLWHFHTEPGERGGSQTPVIEAHRLNDSPLLVKIYNNKGYCSRARIDFNNWQQSPEVWPRRFPGGKP